MIRGEDPWPRASAAEGLDLASETGWTESQLAARTLAAVWACERSELNVSVFFCADSQMRELHERWCGDPGSTDVLSFPLATDDDRCADAEIVVCVDVARERAAEFGNTLRAELALYVAHGALHLLGYDDHDESTLRAMKAAERRVLARLGLCVHGRHDDAV